MSKLPLTPYKGARDFYPEDKFRQDYMFNILRQSVKSFGYEEYDAPLIEPIELYLAKSGEEIVNEQTYTFTDRGGRKVAIRPEMTPTVSRMVAARRQQLAYPLRWFSIPNLWRYERPQRGRLREHWQLNVDLFGVEGRSAELEMIQIINRIFRGFGANSDHYRFKINHRSFMDYLFTDYLQLDREQSHKMAKLIDRKAKISQTEFAVQVDDILSSDQKKNGVAEKLLHVLDVRTLDKLPDKLRKNPFFLQLTGFMDSLTKHGINNADIDLTLMRGFDYYNGIVFESFDTHPDNNRSILGGGRYDGLVGLFGVDPVPTVGFGMGDAMLANFLDVHGLMPDFVNPTDLYVVVVGDELDGALRVAMDLREAGLNVATDITFRRLGEQIKTAVKKGIRYVMFIGSKELTDKHYTLRDLQTSVESRLAFEEIIRLLKKDDHKC